MSKRPIFSLTIVLSVLFCCGQSATSCNNTSQPTHIGPSGAEVAGAVVGVAAVATTAVVLVSVNHSHHNLKGCVFSGPNGLQLRTQDMKDYALTGSTTNLAVGNSVHLHGDRQKHEKGTEQIFLVKELKKSYGPCSVLLASTPSAGAAQKPAPTNSTSGEAHP